MQWRLKCRGVARNPPLTVWFETETLSLRSLHTFWLSQVAFEEQGSEMDVLHVSSADFEAAT